VPPLPPEPPEPPVPPDPPEPPDPLEPELPPVPLVPVPPDEPEPPLVPVVPVPPLVPVLPVPEPLAEGVPVSPLLLVLVAPLQATSPTARIRAAANEAKPSAAGFRQNAAGSEASRRAIANPLCRLPAAWTAFALRKAVASANSEAPESTSPNPANGQRREGGGM
jgi:hypothetical protein